MAQNRKEIETNPTTIIATVQPKALSQVREQLEDIEGITYFSPLVGRFNLAIELKAAEPERVRELVDKIRAMEGITSTRTYTPHEGFARERNGTQAGDSLALAMLQVKGKSDKILKALEQQPQVRNAFAIPGEFDIIATIRGKNHEEVLTQVSKMAEVDGVRTSETLLAYQPTWR
ncbi:MAG: Lrp/AsnC ligand binding domain-containing protein [Nitrososphaerota archaeon]|nr:Lrp/AsnC ligand binding domain-containing protein [Nitrososphaerota archaeon]MDG6991009.1 Lrp/AsnC ligand binding domain-containing protein [Nitrososphaerota archaeon]